VEARMITIHMTFRYQVKY